MKKKYLFVLPVITVLILTFLFRGNRLRADGIEKKTSEESDRGKVTWVVDGDTIHVEMEKGGREKVRLIGINTPERNQYFFTESTQYAIKALKDKEVILTYGPERRDRYGRLLAFVFVDGYLFNKKIIKDGYSPAFLRYPFREDYMKKFREAEEYARKNKLGLWKEK